LLIISEHTKGARYSLHSFANLFKKHLATMD
jgi:hypothetical protein